MMVRGLEWGVGCLSNLDSGQTTPSWCMQGTSTSYTYHLMTRVRRIHRVVYVVPLDKLCSRSNHQALQFYKYDIMRHIALLPDNQEFGWCPLSSFVTLWLPQRGQLIDPVHLICSTQPGFSHTCPIHVYLKGCRSKNLGLIDLLPGTILSVTLHNLVSQNSGLSRTSKSWDCSERSWGFPSDCAAVLRLGNWGCSKKSTKNKLVNRSSDKHSKSVTIRPRLMMSTVCFCFWLIFFSPHPPFLLLFSMVLMVYVGWDVCVVELCRMYERGKK